MIFSCSSIINKTFCWKIGCPTLNVWTLWNDHTNLYIIPSWHQMQIKVQNKLPHVECSWEEFHRNLGKVFLSYQRVKLCEAFIFLTSCQVQKRFSQQLIRITQKSCTFKLHSIVTLPVNIVKIGFTCKHTVSFAFESFWLPPMCSNFFWLYHLIDGGTFFSMVLL